MSHWEACGITVLRSVVLVAMALPICVWLRAFLRTNQRWRGCAWLLLMVPVIAPRMVTGYGYANFSFSMVQYPVWNELLYDILLLITIVPMGTIMSFFAPHAPISAEAMHCLRLAVGRSKRRAVPGEPLARAGITRLQRAGFLMRSRWGQLVPACCLMFVVAFQEFELASLMGVASWTVWLFDAQAGGLVLSQSLRYALLPLTCEVFVLVAACVTAWKNTGLVARPQEVQAALPVAGRRGAWLYLLVGVSLYCCVPWCFVIRTGLAGLPQLMSNFIINRDIWVGCLFAFLAAAFAYGVAAGLFLIHGLEKTRPARTVIAILVSLPGLLGSLVLGLSLLFVFQLPVLHWMYNTPLPWLSGLVLFLMPRAMMVVLLMTVTRSREAQYLIQLLAGSARASQRYQARELQWRTTWALHFGTFLLLFFWAYVDLTAASILAPPGIVSAPVRLYNLMHYGQSAILSAMVLATFGVPALLFSVMVLFRRPLQRALVA